MKFLLALIVLLSAANSLGQCVSNASQTCTPIFNLYLPFHGSYQDTWEVPLNANTSIIDALLSGQSPVPGLLVTNAGVFTNTQMNLYLQATLNSCNALTEYQAVEGSQTVTAPITGCVAVPVGSTVHEADGLLGIANGLSTSTNAVGVRGQARALAANVPVWGLVGVASDNGFADNEVFGGEIDVVSTNAASQGTGLTFQGTLQPGNLFSAIQIAAPTGAPWQQGVSFVPVGGLAACTLCIDFQQGATPTPTGSAAAIIFNPVTFGVNHVSQGFTFISNDPSSGQNQVNVNEDALGNFVIANGKTGTGVALNHINQNSTKDFAGTCTMAAGTSCTFTLAVGGYSSAPVCIPAVQSATVIAGGCTVSGTTVTITAASSNSQLWGAVLIGNPN